MTRRYKPVHTMRQQVGKIALIVFVVLGILLSPLLSWILGPSHVLARPFWWISQTFNSAAQNTAQLSKSKRSLVQEVNNARAEAARLAAVDAENRYLRSENEELQTLLGRTSAVVNSVTGRVLVRPPQTWYDSVIVDVGSDDGVAIGNAAYAYGTISIGRVVAVTTSTAIVELYSASNRTTDAILLPGNVPVAMNGTGNSSFQFDVHRDLAVDEQSTIILPTGELLGTVASVQFDTRDPFRSVRAVSPVNVQHLRFVTIAR